MYRTSSQEAFDKPLLVSEKSGEGSGTRPSFSSSNTSDRLRESERLPAVSCFQAFKPNGHSPRTSAFLEIGLLDDIAASPIEISYSRHYTQALSPGCEEDGKPGKNESISWIDKFAETAKPALNSASSAPPATFSTVHRIVMIVFLIAIVIPSLRYGGFGKLHFDGVGAGIILGAEVVENGFMMAERSGSQTSTCTRWSHQSAVVNGTLYIYGGRSKTSSGQNSNTWNNNFLSLDLTKNWAIASPSLTGLPQPTGPPAVANGYLWNSYTSLFLYGGEFSDTPPISPVSVSTWEYDILKSSWIEHANPTTATGNYSAAAGMFVQRSAEGAGLSVPELGLSWYFGGHQDLYTTQGWSNQIPRIYLRNLLEFTHPGYQNTGVQGLGVGEHGAPSGGAYRNITEGGLQSDAGFTERADGVLVYVPGWGSLGIIIGLAGGAATTFTEMNEIDIYDIESSTWYRQATSGPTPSIRVNPCAAVFAAPDASSFNIYLYGGQNLQPAGNQTQYGDLWILSIPSFTWIPIPQASSPPARAGHTCHAWDGQLVVVGGYVGAEISCDSPGIYVLNATSLLWNTAFSALSGSNSPNIPASGAGLSGSYGYRVPMAVQSVVGGGQDGGATATSPAVGAPTDGPIATGRPPTFTVTGPGSTVVQTAFATATAPAAVAPKTDSGSGGLNVGAVVAGVIAGALGVLAAYLGWCVWLYRRRLDLYRSHVAMGQRASSGFTVMRGGDQGKAIEKLWSGPQLGVFGTPLKRDSGSPGRSEESATEELSGSKRTMSAADIRSGVGDGREHSGAQSEIPLPAAWSHGSATSNSSAEDLLGGQEPSFVSVVMSPRRTLRVINRD